MKRSIQTALCVAVSAIIATGLCFLSSASAADNDMSKSESKLSAADKKFIKKAYKGGMMEVESAKMAKEKAKNDATKEVADRIMADHTKANEELMNIAKEENLDLSKTETKAMSMSASGDNFDKEYLTMMKKDHEKDIADFEKEANDAGTKEDSDVKAFAKKTLPTLKEHLQMVEDALAKMK
jgi:putative membrane protein